MICKKEDDEKVESENSNPDKPYKKSKVLSISNIDQKPLPLLPASFINQSKPGQSTFDKIFDAEDLDNPDQINYPEFLVATYQEDMLDEHNLQVAFDWFDSGSKSHLTIQDFETRFTLDQRSFKNKDIVKMFDEVGWNADKQVKFCEFQEKMTGIAFR